MTIRTFVAAFVVVLLAPAANAALSEPAVSPSPTVSRQMQWFRWQPPVRAVGRLSVGRPAVHVGSVAASGDRRIRYLAPLGPTRRLAAMPNDPLLSMIDTTTGLP